MVINSPVRIGVLGAHSTGKTLLLHRMEMELRARGITVGRTGGLGKRAKEVGLPKMQHHTYESTEWIIAQGIADEIIAAQGNTVVLADRAALDAVAYFYAALEYRGDYDTERRRLLALAAGQSWKYDLLLATVLDPAVPVSDGHDYDARYRTLVDLHVHRLLATEKLDHVCVTSDPDSKLRAVEGAVGFVLDGGAA
ncbi:AAA family ATPase [Streptomyces sp. NPDC056132]|uniref:AAA family ATPase n=1 Tax=Streptomyces sp. NPDC056132 TaxID=3345722 RepID=UPI0035E1C6D8